MQHHLLPPKAVHKAGDHRCGYCGRMVEPQKRANPKGTCKCESYQDISTFCADMAGVKPSKMVFRIDALTNAYPSVAAIDWIITGDQLRVHDGWRMAGYVTGVAHHMGRQRIFGVVADINHNALLTAMTLAILARSVPYNENDDTRGPTLDVDLRYAYVIKLPTGADDCEILSVDIVKGWGAASLAYSCWKLRRYPADHFIGDRVRDGSTLEDMVKRANSINELKMLWRNANDMRPVTPEQKVLFTARKRELTDTLEVAS